jgi:hypothetical protein
VQLYKAYLAGLTGSRQLNLVTLIPVEQHAAECREWVVSHPVFEVAAGAAPANEVNQI